MTSGFCATVRTALLHNWRPEVLDSNNMPTVSDALEGQSKTMVKIFALEKYLTDDSAHIADTDVIFLLDAFDTWLQQTPDFTLQLFLAEEARLNLGNAVLFSAEKNCFPRAYYCDYAPESSLPFDTYGPDGDTTPELSRPRYLNSGGFIGRKKNVLNVLRQVIEHVGDRHNILDQAIVLEMYANQTNGEIIELDFPSYFFHSVHKAVDDMVWMPDRLRNNDGVKRVINKYSGTQPVCLHWNGRKEIMNNYWKFVHPAINQSMPAEATYMDEMGQSVRYEDVCVGELAPTIEKNKIWWD